MPPPERVQVPFGPPLGRTFSRPQAEAIVDFVRRLLAVLGGQVDVRLASPKPLVLELTERSESLEPLAEPEENSPAGDGIEMFATDADGDQYLTLGAMGTWLGAVVYTVGLAQRWGLLEIKDDEQVVMIGTRIVGETVIEPGFVHRMPRIDGGAPMVLQDCEVDCPMVDRAAEMLIEIANAARL